MHSLLPHSNCVRWPQLTDPLVVGATSLVVVTAAVEPAPRVMLFPPVEAASVEDTVDDVVAEDVAVVSSGEVGPTGVVPLSGVLGATSVAELLFAATAEHIKSSNLQPSAPMQSFSLKSRLQGTPSAFT